jgi:hypothetical protein
MWFTERWVKSSRFSASELRVLRELLPRGDVYSDKLFSQAKDAPYVERRLIVWMRSNDSICVR